MNFRRAFYIILTSLFLSSIASSKSLICNLTPAEIIEGVVNSNNGKTSGKLEQTLRSEAQTTATISQNPRQAVVRFKEEYVSFKRVSEQENIHFLQVAESGDTKLIYTSENAILQEMNGPMLQYDKDLATALTNKQKNITMDEIAKYPRLRNAISAQYSDYKTMRFALNTDDPLVIADLQKATEAANREFAAIAEGPMMELYFSDQTRRGLASDPKNWFLTGVGHTVDESGAAARAARSSFVPGADNPVLFKSYAEVRSRLNIAANKAETLRRTFIQNLPSGNGKLAVKVGAKGEVVLSDEAIDVFKKIRGQARDENDFIHLAQNRFQSQFQVRLSEDQVKRMREYVNAVDVFSPGLLQTSRTLPDLAKATNGAVSIDFAGMGSRNLHELMVSLVGVKDPDTALKMARQAEQKVTRELNAQKEHILQVEKSFGFSGDDAIALPNHDLTTAQKVKLVDAVGHPPAGTPGSPSQYRMTFLSQKTRAGEIIPASERAAWINSAESLEKSIRVVLGGSIPPESLKNITIAVDLIPSQQVVTGTLKGSEAQIFIGGSLTDNERILLQRLIRRKLNDEGILYQRGGVTSN